MKQHRFTLVALVLVIVAVVLSAEKTSGNQTCGVGEWFDRQSSGCRSLCAKGEIFDRDTGMCKITETESGEQLDPRAIRLKARPTCKTLVFQESRYKFVADSDSAYVAVLPKTVSAADYQVNATTHELSFCFNFSDAFMRCDRWALESNEFELRDGGFRIWVNAYDTLYETGDFLIKELQTGEREAIVCARQDHFHASHQRVAVHVYLASWIISDVCLVVALVLCVTVAGLRAYNQVLPFYITSLFVAYFNLVLRTLEFGTHNAAVCYLYAVTLQFSFLSAFFWLNILAFDIWRAVANFRSGGQEVVAKKWRTLICYMGYGWGTPLLIVVFTVVVDTHVVSNSLQPNFSQNCWFQSDHAKLVFFYGPIAAILVINVLFFVLTLVNIKVATNASHESIAKKKHLVRMTLELAVVMGLCWIMEVVSWGVGGDDRYWYVTDVINGLQGLFILLVILRKPVVLNAVCLRLGLRKKEDNSQTTDVTTQDKGNTMRAFNAS